MAVSDGKVVFYKTHREALESVILESNPDRNAVVAKHLRNPKVGEDRARR